ncbi:MULTISPECIES: hypothetical protein [unclassified Pseudonocardia]|uniref:hypothetical protein n=1 Tax=unclassified Pseudonocardia TaxID=2619320 RepID=UPI000A7AB7EE|nr:MULTISPECIES: hypothetical protein [unclassified Pseudonocardia]
MPKTVVSSNNVEWFVRASCLGQILQEVVVEASYKTPPAFFTTIKLTQKGARLAKEVRGDGVDAPDAQLAAFITGWSGDECLLDSTKLILEDVRDLASSELRRGKMVLPWIYGRDLYDRVADSNFHGDSYPTEAQVDSVLDGMPRGVFQAGPYITGPLGVIESEQWRRIEPASSALSYHCEEVDCDRVHRVHFANPRNAIARSFRELRDKVSRSTRTDSANDDAFWKFGVQRWPPFDWSNLDGVASFLVDCFSISERRSLLRTLLTSGSGQYMREAIRGVDQEVGDAARYVDGLDAAKLLQLTLLAKNEDLHFALNHCVWRGEMRIPFGEVRSSRIVDRQGTGSLRVRLEGSEFGVRTRPSRALSVLRLRSLVRKIYLNESGDWDNDLSWRLREYEGSTIDEKLTYALADAEPRRLIEVLLTGNETACERAFLDLNLPVTGLREKTDRQLTDLITWHLGFAVNYLDEDLSQVEEGLAKLKMFALAMPKELPDRNDLGRMREVAGPLFPALERALKKTLFFAIWSLLKDHYSEAGDMSYTPGTARDFSLQWIKSQGLELRDEGDSDFTLGDLLTAIGRFAQYLKGVERSRASHQRSKEDWPRLVREPGSPFSFPFQHTIPFLDLSDAAASKIAEGFAILCREMNRCGILTVRNGLLHDKEEYPSSSVIQEACESVLIRLGEILDRGFYPTEFQPAENSGDSYGRDRFVLKDPRGLEVVLLRPSNMYMLGFPGISSRQIVYPTARLRHTGEPLRFRLRQDSHYEASWRDFPRRPGRSVAARTEADTNTAVGA